MELSILVAACYLQSGRTLVAHLGAWGRCHLPVTRELAARAELLERGGPELWEQFMDELREQHLGRPRPTDSESVIARLRAAYEAELARG